MPKSKAAGLESECRRWNKENPVGTWVEFHPVIGKPEHRLRRTSGPAYVLSGHTPVVTLEGERGCVALAACVVTLTPAKPTLEFRQVAALERLAAAAEGIGKILDFWHHAAVKGITEGSRR